MHWNYWNFTRQNLTAEVGKENQTHRAFGKTHLEASMAHLWLEMWLWRQGMWCKTKTIADWLRPKNYGMAGGGTSGVVQVRKDPFPCPKLWSRSWAARMEVPLQAGVVDRGFSVWRRLQWQYFCRPLCFLARNSPFFSTDPHEVCEGVLPHIIVKRAMKQESCRTRGKGPHLVHYPFLQGG